MRDHIVFHRSENPALVEILGTQAEEQSMLLLLLPTVQKSPLWLSRLDSGAEKLVCQTQNLYPFIPYSLMSAGATVAFVVDPRTNRETRPAIVADRYWQPEDMKWLKDKLQSVDPGQAVVYTPELKISAAEFDFLSLGYRARQMEDKWNILPAGNTVHLMRSWTGLEMYRLEFSPAADGNYHLRRMLIRREWQHDMSLGRPVSDGGEASIKLGLRIVKNKLEMYRETVLK